MLVLSHSFTSYSNGSATIHCSQMPPNPSLFAPGPAMLYVKLLSYSSTPLLDSLEWGNSFVVVKGIPSFGHELMIGTGQLGEQPTRDATVLPASSDRAEVEGEQGNRQHTSDSGRNEAIIWVAYLVFVLSVLSFDH